MDELSPASPSQHIRLEACKDGGLYRIWSRNLLYGVFRAKTQGFIGIREKFGHEYLFEEYHHDTGPPYGTVKPTDFLEPCLIQPIAEDNERLFAWLKEREQFWNAENPRA